MKTRFDSRKVGQTVPGASRSPGARQGGRPSKAKPFEPLVREILEGDPAVPSSEILRLARLAGYSGQKSALFELIASVRPAPPREVGALHGLPGEVSEHELVEAGAGAIVLASRLRWSGWLHATRLPSRAVEATTRALGDHFVAFGGVPMLAVVDPALPGARECTEPGRTDALLGQLVFTLGVGLEVGGRSARSAGGPGKIVEAALTASAPGPAEIDGALAALCRSHNSTAAPGRRRTPTTRLEDERRRLRPLRVTPDALVLRARAVVDRRGYVEHADERWPVPPVAIGALAEILLGRDEVRILAAGVEVVRRREPPASGDG